MNPKVIALALLLCLTAGLSSWATHEYSESHIVSNDAAASV